MVHQVRTLAASAEWGVGNGEWGDSIARPWRSGPDGSGVGSADAMRRINRGEASGWISVSLTANAVEINRDARVIHRAFSKFDVVAARPSPRPSPRARGRNTSRLRDFVEQPIQRHVHFVVAHVGAVGDGGAN